MLPFALDRTLTWVDLETTSKVPREARIVEISIVQFLPDGTTKDWWSLINPGVSIPAESTLKHGITDDDVIGKPRFEDICARILPAFRRCDYGGYNVRYDTEVLKYEYARAGVSAMREPDDPPARVLDGLRLWQIVEPRTLTDFIKRWCSRPHEGAHSAKADVEGTIEGVRSLLMATPQDVLPWDIQKLHDLSFPRDPNALDAKGMFVRGADGVALFGFGKHKGKPAASEQAYLNWWVSQPGRSREEVELVRTFLR